jgi:hypothetical protein
MPFGQSIPIAAPVSAITGLLCGELARHIAKELGAGEVGQRIATGVTHAISSAAAGYAVNTALGVDVTGAAVTTVQSLGTAAAHAVLPAPHGILTGGTNFGFQ